MEREDGEGSQRKDQRVGLSVCAFDVASATGGGGTLMDVARHRKTSLCFNQIHRITTQD